MTKHLWDNDNWSWAMRDRTSDTDVNETNYERDARDRVSDGRTDGERETESGKTEAERE
jgi:hypothetical protein